MFAGTPLLHVVALLTQRVLLLLLQNALLSAVTPSKQRLKLPNTLKAYAQLNHDVCDVMPCTPASCLYASVSHKQEVDPVVVNTATDLLASSVLGTCKASLATPTRPVVSLVCLPLS